MLSLLYSARAAARRVVFVPVLFWSFVTILAIATAVAVDARLEGDGAAPTMRTLVVARRDLEPGDALVDGVALDRAISNAPDALTEIPPEGAVAGSEIAAGEVVLGRRVDPVPGPGAAITDGRKGVWVPVVIGFWDDVALVDVMTGGDVVGAGGPVDVVAETVPVIGRTEGALLLALDRQAAIDVAEAMAGGSVTLAVSSGR